MAVSREVLLELSGRDGDTFHDLWRKTVIQEAKECLAEFMFEGTTQYDHVLNGVVQFVEDYGCTPERAVMIAMFPDRYAKDKAMRTGPSASNLRAL